MPRTLPRKRGLAGSGSIFLRRFSTCVSTTRSVIEVLAACDHPLTITTKGALIERDVDLLVSIKRSDEPELLNHLKSAGINPLREPPALTIGESRILQLAYEPPDRFLD